MNDPSRQSDLGGRLPLLKPDQLDTEQKKTYDQIDSTLIPWAKESDFEAKSADGALLGPFNAMLYSPALATGQTAYLQAEREHTSLSPQLREVVILTVGAVWKATYELYAHRAVAAKAGISETDINALSMGDPAMGLGEEAIMAHRFVHAVVKQHTVPDTLFQDALEMFGYKRLIDMIHLASLYMGTSAMLNVFAVPTPE